MNQYERRNSQSPITTLVEAFNRLPGIGPKSAQRLAYHVLRAPEKEAQELANSLLEVKRSITLCDFCQNLTDLNPCRICTDSKRDSKTICVVEEPLDVQALERTGSYMGLYHVLHGVIAPSDGIGPSDLKIAELLKRIRDSEVEIDEVIVATNPNLEGDATSMYLARLLGPLGINITHLARGLPAGADLEYADDVTLNRALEFRQKVLD
ncbi:MAG: recombination mediator RecR [Dehalococcoidia bacterium]|nr:recombination mediator RecR [Dehalococcoidia bacterium]